MAVFHRLVRFMDPTGQIFFGELRDKVPASQQELLGLEIEVFQLGLLPWQEGFKLSGARAKIEKILSPLPSVPQFLCIGLNYRQHAEEANFPIPEFPMVFSKPPDTLAGPYDEIEIPLEAKCMDYETSQAECCVIIGKDLKSSSPSESLAPFILGYSVGNDVSARYWQDPGRSGGQHGFAKSFDKFAPFGPTIVSPETLGDITKLKMTTMVNGELRQESRLDDLIFSVDQLLRHLSMGRTVKAGTVVMTGTPSGVAAFMKPAPQWLVKGDVVEIMLEGVGTIKNTFV
ncbi:fumarylacetoacetate hydrolase family protein [Stipitochalara longipes BDJ]|nr:fumarylacetoacetate hydrolase family protein [Stipitochalara longipes BDJ]